MTHLGGPPPIWRWPMERDLLAAPSPGRHLRSTCSSWLGSAPRRPAGAATSRSPCSSTCTSPARWPPLSRPCRRRSPRPSTGSGLPGPATRMRTVPVEELCAAIGVSPPGTSPGVFRNHYGPLRPPRRLRADPAGPRPRRAAAEQLRAGRGGAAGRLHESVPLLPPVPAGVRLPARALSGYGLPRIRRNRSGAVGCSPGRPIAQFASFWPFRGRCESTTVARSRHSAKLRLALCQKTGL